MFSFFIDFLYFLYLSCLISPFLVFFSWYSFLFSFHLIPSFFFFIHFLYFLYLTFLISHCLVLSYNLPFCSSMRLSFFISLSLSLPLSYSVILFYAFLLYQFSLISISYFLDFLVSCLFLYLSLLFVCASIFYHFSAVITLHVSRYIFCSQYGLFFLFPLMFVFSLVIRLH